MLDGATLRRPAAVGAALALILGLTACDNPDFSGVKFRPVVSPPDAFKTAIKGYVFTTQPWQPAWGNEFLLHSRAPGERDLSPLSGARLILDEATVLAADGSGLFGSEGLGAGYHSLKVSSGKAQLPGLVRVTKDHVTLVALVKTAAGTLTQTDMIVPHTFVTAPLFRELLAYRYAVIDLLDRYAKARSEGDVHELRRLLADEYVDSEGGREDLLRALRYKGQLRQNTVIKGFTATLDPGGKSGVVVARVQGDGTLDFEKIDLKTDASASWRIAAIAE